MNTILNKKIRTVLADPRTYPTLSMAGMLQWAARLFGVCLRLRASCYRMGLFKTHRLPCTVISIGNITSGGTGKTPMTLYTARLLRRLGHRVAILSRGYKGGAEKKGGVVCDGRDLLMTPASAGDEPYMMARFLKDVPVLVGKNRVASGHLAVSRFAPDIVLLDDGFQHRRLHRDMDIVLLDSTRPLGNGFLLPRGILRESPGSLARADAIIFTRFHEDLPDPTALLPESVPGRSVFRSRNIPFIYHTDTSPSESSQVHDLHHTSDLKGKKVFAFSAIADNTDFHRVLADLGCKTTGTRDFSDHHAYNLKELERIGRDASGSGAQILVTTQKDFHKFPKNVSWPLPLVILGVLPAFFKGKEDFDEFIIKTVSELEGPGTN